MCRRILVANCIPVAPAAWFVNIDNVCFMPMSMVCGLVRGYASLKIECLFFCCIPTLIGVRDVMARLEREVWGEVNPAGPVVPSDTILDYLLNEGIKEVFGDS